MAYKCTMHIDIIKSSIKLKVHFCLRMNYTTHGGWFSKDSSLNKPIRAREVLVRLSSSSGHHNGPRLITILHMQHPGNYLVYKMDAAEKKCSMSHCKAVRIASPSEATSQV